MTVILKFLGISLKPQFITVVLQFSLKPQLVTIVSKLFLVHPCFSGIVILILFLKIFYHNNHKITVSNCGFENILKNHSPKLWFYNFL